jgi:DegV family protein with EDD domain
LDGEPFDDRTGAIDDFYARLRGGAIATTSQPSPAQLGDAYNRAASRGAQSVISIHLDARASGTVSSAELAARDARIPVTVVDTRTVSFGVGVCVRTAAEVAAAGGSRQDAIEAVTRRGAAMENVFVARDSRLGGRVPAVGAAWALLSFEGESAALISECSSAAGTVDAIESRARRSERPISVAVGHAGREVEAAADELAHRLVGTDGIQTVERYRVGAAIGAHTGPDSFGMFWWPTQ